MKLTSLYVLIFIPLISSAGIVSGIDQKFKVDRLQKSSSSLGHKSSGVSFYQKILSQTLGSHCKLYPNDSYYAQINFQRCSKGRSILKSMSRFFMEPDVATFTKDIILKKEIYYVDLPTDCDLL